MITKLISKLSSHRRTRITIEVRETNLAAQLFFHEQGFRGIRVLRSFYGDSGEDAYLMELHNAQALDDDGEYPLNRLAQFEES